MTWWEIAAPSIPYSVCGLVCARMIAGHLAWKWKWSSHLAPDTAQWFGAAICGLALGVIWPLVLVTVKLPMSRLAVGEEAAEIRRRQAKRIAELEREAGIR